MEENLMIGAFAGVVAKPMFNQLAAGEHEVRAARVEYSDSFTNFDGTAKESDREWQDPDPQAIVVYGSTKAGEGGHTQRYQALGYTHTSDASDAELEAGKFSDDRFGVPAGTKFTVADDYLLVTNKAKQLVRLPSEKNTQACSNILNQLFIAAGIPEGTPVPDAFAQMRDEGRPLIINIKKTTYQGKDQYRISSYKAVSKKVTADELD
jgi:hypothetical protein